MSMTLDRVGMDLNLSMREASFKIYIAEMIWWPAMLT